MFNSAIEGTVTTQFIRMKSDAIITLAAIGIRVKRVFGVISLKIYVDPRTGLVGCSGKKKI